MDNEKCEYGHPEPCGETATFVIYMPQRYFPIPIYSCDKHIHATAPFPNCTVRHIETRNLFKTGESVRVAIEKYNQSFQ